MVISLNEGISCNDTCAMIWYIKLLSARSLNRSLVFPHFTPSFPFPCTLNLTSTFRFLYSGGLLREAMLDSVSTISTFTSENNKITNDWRRQRQRQKIIIWLITCCMCGSHLNAILRCGVPNLQHGISNLRSQQKREHKLNGKSFIL